MNKPEPRKGRVGDMLSSGQVVLTATGRATSPFPKVGKITAGLLRKVDLWLRDNAIAEALARGDRWNADLFKEETGKTIPKASKDSMEEYLFGENTFDK